VQLRYYSTAVNTGEIPGCAGNVKTVASETFARTAKVFLFAAFVSFEVKAAAPTGAALFNSV
jgi:hypothetical protein